ncbi:MAG: hypothetical protein ACOYOS_14145 [Syntrophales bacterium]
MIDYIHEVENIAEKYGLQITSLDATDVTLMVRMEIMPSVFIQIYRNVKKNKLNMALVSGNNRIYGADSEGGIPHEHPIQQPWSHIETEKEPELEEFIFKCLRYLQERNII